MGCARRHRIRCYGYLGTLTADGFLIVFAANAGNGIGKALIRLAESECLELGLHEIRLSTHRDIIENINLYKHLGWHIIDDIGNKIHMSKTINLLLL